MMKLKLLVEHNLIGIKLFQVMPILGLFLMVVFHFYLDLSFIDSWIISLIWAVTFTILGLLFLRCLLYSVEVDSSGVRLWYIRICKNVIDANYRDRRGKRVRDKKIEVNRKEGWVLVRWRDIENIEVNRRGARKCVIELKNGDRLYYLNNVDWEIRKGVKEAWERWKEEKVK